MSEIRFKPAEVAYADLTDNRCPQQHSADTSNIDQTSVVDNELEVAAAAKPGGLRLRTSAYRMAGKSKARYVNLYQDLRILSDYAGQDNDCPAHLYRWDGLLLHDDAS